MSVQEQLNQYATAIDNLEMPYTAYEILLEFLYSTGGMDTVKACVGHINATYSQRQYEREEEFATSLEVQKIYDDFVSKLPVGLSPMEQAKAFQKHYKQVLSSKLKSKGVRT